MKMLETYPMVVVLFKFGTKIVIRVVSDYSSHITGIKQLRSTFGVKSWWEVCTNSLVS